MPIFAPVPGHHKRKLYHAAVNQVAAEQAKLQNEPKSLAATAPKKPSPRCG